MNRFLTAGLGKPARILSIMSCLLVVAIGQGCGKGPTQQASHEEADIVAVLNQQVEAWNQADIPSFMETYIKGDALRFSSGGTVRRGWQATLERYLTTYPTPEAMGHLDFEELEVLILSEQWAQVHGRYRLKREGSYGNATGLFTLLLQHTDAGWKILHDHTSAAE